MEAVQRRLRTCKDRRKKKSVYKSSTTPMETNGVFPRDALFSDCDIYGGYLTLDGLSVLQSTNELVMLNDAEAGVRVEAGVDGHVFLLGDAYQMQKAGAVDRGVVCVGEEGKLEPHWGLLNTISNLEERIVALEGVAATLQVSVNALESNVQDITNQITLSVWHLEYDDLVMSAQGPWSVDEATHAVVEAAGAEAGDFVVLADGSVVLVRTDPEASTAVLVADSFGEPLPLTGQVQCIIRGAVLFGSVRIVEIIASSTGMASWPTSLPFLPVLMPSVSDPNGRDELKVVNVVENAQNAPSVRLVTQPGELVDRSTRSVVLETGAHTSVLSNSIDTWYID
jgi:hypothetical protein